MAVANLLIRIIMCSSWTFYLELTLPEKMDTENPFVQQLLRVLKKIPFYPSVLQKLGAGKPHTTQKSPTLMHFIKKYWLWSKVANTYILPID